MRQSNSIIIPVFVPFDSSESYRQHLGYRKLEKFVCGGRKFSFSSSRFRKGSKRRAILNHNQQVESHALPLDSPFSLSLSIFVFAFYEFSFHRKHLRESYNVAVFEEHRFIVFPTKSHLAENVWRKSETSTTNIKLAGISFDLFCNSVSKNEIAWKSSWSEIQRIDRRERRSI